MSEDRKEVRIFDPIIAGVDLFLKEVPRELSGEQEAAVSRLLAAMHIVENNTGHQFNKSVNIINVPDSASVALKLRTAKFLSIMSISENREIGVNLKSLVKLDEKELVAILTHEMDHDRNQDTAVKESLQ